MILSVLNMDYERLHITWRGLNEVAPGECVSAYVPRIMSPSERGTERTLLLQYKRLRLAELAGMEAVEIHTARQLCCVERHFYATKFVTSRM